MTHEQAMALLDRVRDGGLYPPHAVNFALMMTGDLIDHGSETEEILWQVPAGEAARGWCGYVQSQVGMRCVLGAAGVSV